MNLREEGTIPPIHDLAKFLASSITFMTSLAEVSLYLDDKRLIRLTKVASGGPIAESIPRGMKTASISGIMTVKGVQRTRMSLFPCVCHQILIHSFPALHISAEIMKWVHSSPSPKPAPSKPVVVAPQAAVSAFFGKLVSTFSAPAPPPPVIRETIRLEDLLAVKESSVDLTIFSAEVAVRLDKKLTSDLQRSTKKNPPSRLKYELVYVSAILVTCILRYKQVVQTGKSEYDASKSSEDAERSVFEGLRANLDG